jgi:hypothetical protein
VVDPAGLWVPDELACSAGDEILPVAGEIDERLLNEEAIARRSLTLEDAHEINPPGYPDAIRAQMLPVVMMVQRDGIVVGKLHVWLGRPARVEGEVCSSSGIRSQEAGDGSSQDADPADEIVDEGPLAPALRVRCGPDGTQVLTPVVKTQHDGLHVEPVDVADGWTIGLFSADPWMSDWSWWSGSEGVNDEFVREIPPGDTSVVCQREQEWTSESEDDELRASSAPFLLIDADDYHAPLNPECTEPGELRELHENTRAEGIDPAHAESDIRDSLGGVLATDIVEMAGYHTDWGSRYWWRIVRDGRVVAALIVGEQGGGVINGWTCPSSGIEGDPSSA